MTKVIYTKSHFDWLRKANCVLLHQHRKKLTGTVVGSTIALDEIHDRPVHILQVAWNRPHLGIKGLLDRGSHFADNLEDVPDA
jgi:hypothetical protein